MGRKIFHGMLVAALLGCNQSPTAPEPESIDCTPSDPIIPDSGLVVFFDSADSSITRLHPCAAGGE